MSYESNSGSVYYALTCGIPSDVDLNPETNTGTDYYRNSANEFILWGQSEFYPAVESNSGSNYYFYQCIPDMTNYPGTRSANLLDEAGNFLLDEAGEFLMFQFPEDFQSNSGTVFYYSSAFNCVSFCD